MVYQVKNQLKSCSALNRRPICRSEMNFGDIERVYMLLAKEVFPQWLSKPVQYSAGPLTNYGPLNSESNRCTFKSSFLSFPITHEEPDNDKRNRSYMLNENDNG